MGLEGKETRKGRLPGKRPQNMDGICDVFASDEGNITETEWSEGFSMEEQNQKHVSGHGNFIINKGTLLVSYEYTQIAEDLFRR